MKQTIEEILKKYPDQNKAIKELANFFSIELTKPAENYQLLSLQYDDTKKIQILDIADNIKYTSEKEKGSHLLIDQLRYVYDVDTVTIETPYYKIKKSIQCDDNKPLLEEILTFSNKKYEVNIKKTNITNISSSYNNNVEIILCDNTESYKPMIFSKAFSFNNRFNTPDSGYIIVDAYYNSPQYNEKNFPISQDNRTCTVYEGNNSIIYSSEVLLKNSSGGWSRDYGDEDPEEKIYSMCFENAKYVNSRVYYHKPSIPGIIGTPLEWKTTQAGMVFYINAENRTYSDVNIYKDDKQITIDIESYNPYLFYDREHKTYTIDNLQTGPITPAEIDKIIDVINPTQIELISLEKNQPKTRYLELMQNELTVFKNKILEKNKKRRLSAALLLTDPKYYSTISLEKYADIIKYDMNKIIRLLSKEYVKEAQKSKVVDQEHQKVKIK